MTEQDNSTSDIQNADKLQEKREKIMDKVQADAKQMLEEAHKAGVQGDHASIEIETEEGTWTLKRDGSKKSVKYLRFANGVDIYVISQYDPAPVKKFLKAMKDYDAFVAGFNDWLDEQEDDLDELMDEIDDVEVGN